VADSAAAGLPLVWQSVIPMPLLQSLRPDAAALQDDRLKNDNSSNSCLSLPIIVGSRTVFTAVAYWPSLKHSLTRLVGGTFPVGAGLGKAWYAVEASGRYARWVTLIEASILRGNVVRVPNTYWGFLLGSIFVGRYDSGGAVCLFMREVDCPAPDPAAVPHSPGYVRELGEKKDSVSRDEEVEAVLKDGDEFAGILLFPGEVPLPAHAHSSNHTPIHTLSQTLTNSNTHSLISLALALSLSPTRNQMHSAPHRHAHTQSVSINGNIRALTQVV